jgi:hypothetical protein
MTVSLVVKNYQDKSKAESGVAVLQKSVTNHSDTTSILVKIPAVQHPDSCLNNVRNYSNNLSNNLNSYCRFYPQ